MSTTPLFEPVAYRENITGRVCLPDDEHRTRFPMCYSPLYAAPQPAVETRKITADEEAVLYAALVKSGTIIKKQPADEIVAWRAAAEMMDAVIESAATKFVRVPYGASHEDVAAINEWHKMAAEARAAFRNLKRITPPGAIATC